MDGVGLTPFKIYSEYAIILIIAISLAILVSHRRQFEPRVFYLLAASFVLAILSGLSFTLYMMSTTFSTSPVTRSGLSRST